MKATPRFTQNRKPTAKENKSGQKKTLKEVAGKMLSDIIGKAHEERMNKIRIKQVEQEDEVAVMTFGPNWREEESSVKLILLPAYDPEAAE